MVYRVSVNFRAGYRRRIVFPWALLTKPPLCVPRTSQAAASRARSRSGGSRTAQESDRDIVGRYNHRPFRLSSCTYSSASLSAFIIGNLATPATIGRFL
jgi:hypothetical protein